MAKHISANQQTKSVKNSSIHMALQTGKFIRTSYLFETHATNKTCY